MGNIFLVFGYGIPKDILKDENYNFYLKMVFNKVYDISVNDNSKKSLIIFCGGRTDMSKPYQRTEAEEMARFFANLIKNRTFLNQITKKWMLIPEKESLSTLENIINSKKIIKSRKIDKDNIFIFCEHTREKRIKTLAKKIFDKDYDFQVLSIDFDISVNRYLPAEFVAKKEQAELKHSLLALESPEKLKKHHQIFAEKFEYLRKMGQKRHTEAVKKWWEEKLKELEN
jgi:hypothetical protein